jgi:hypothetical protein
LPFL